MIPQKKIKKTSIGQSLSGSKSVFFLVELKISIKVLVTGIYQAWILK